jgi:tRNA (guanine-N7-)-methyltransferase
LISHFGAARFEFIAGARRHPVTVDEKPPTNTVLPAAGSLLWKLNSITERLALAEMFPRPQPLEIESGSGDGSFLVNYAARHPERNFLGVERLLGRLRKLDRKGRRAGLANLRGLRIESAYFLEYLLPPGTTSAVHVYFPDPWPKRKHRKNRLVNGHFVELAHRALLAGGHVYLRTDDADYFSEMVAAFASSPLFRLAETPVELSGVITDFEREFRSRNVATLRAAYVRGV